MRAEQPHNLAVILDPRLGDPDTLPHDNGGFNTCSRLFSAATGRVADLVGGGNGRAGRLQHAR
jgi:hypothetical protein